MIVVLPEIVPVCPGFFVTVGYHLPSCARHHLKGKTHHSERYASDGRNCIFLFYAFWTVPIKAMEILHLEEPIPFDIGQRKSELQQLYIYLMICGLSRGFHQNFYGRQTKKRMISVWPIRIGVTMDDSLIRSG